MNMRRRHGVVVVSVLVCLGAIPSTASRADEGVSHGLMPAPAEVVFGKGGLSLEGRFSVRVMDHSDDRLWTGIARLNRRLADRTGISIEARNMDSPVPRWLEIHCEGPGEDVQTIAEDESYYLHVTRLTAELRAKTVVGALRGMATFEQLVELGADGFVVPCVTIRDRPRFVWRGLLIDACRHWQPIEVIKRNLDGMAAVKLSVLHWHLTEDQGFRVECKAFPRLHGAGSDGSFYTQEQICDVLAYARGLGIRVVPEFDMPGHSASWLVGYPELGAGAGPFEIVRRWGVFDPCFDPTREQVYTFLDKFIGEMAGLFPDAYLHVGGDEVNGKLWTGSAEIQAFMKKQGLKDKHDLQAYFNRRVSEILVKHGRKMIGWDEIMHPDLPGDIVIQSWRGPDALVAAAREGRMAILSNGYYLDHQQPASFHYAVDPLAKAGGLDEADRGRILGGEACMWGEFVTPETIDSRIWPRLAAVAERLWSPAEVNDVEDMYRRLEIVGRQLDRIGLLHEANYERMLRRLAGRHRVEPLRELADIVTPLKGYGRSATGTYTSFSPLNRLVDAARPESAAARRFDRLVDGALSGALTASADRLAVKQQLLAWRGNYKRLEPIIRDSALLREVAPVSENVALLASAGLEALKLIQLGQTPPREWRKAQEEVLRRAGESYAEVDIAIIPAIRKLLDGAGKLPD